MNAKTSGADEINAAPTKAFFVEMLVRDIPLEQAILDLVDNSVDGAKRINSKNFRGRTIDITIGADFFRIVDDCGGFDTKTARDYAFRFGRPPEMPLTPHSIGQFGVGMKRALFKFGRHFVVRSATSNETWAIDVNVEKWLKDSGNWHFSWAKFDKHFSQAKLDKKIVISKENPGTDILVSDLRPEVSQRFATTQFVNAIEGLIKSKHRQFIAMGLRIVVNDRHLHATDLYLLTEGRLQAGVDNLSFGSGNAAVKVRIVVGIGSSLPREAGWYVICNGRVILEADRRERTGWGLIEYDEDRILMPSFHNQFARFRGIVSFDSRNAYGLPWNTTKTDVDEDHPVWRKTFQRMIEMMRPVINFLNELDKDVDEHSRDNSPLYEFVTKAGVTNADALTKKMEFKAPQRGALTKMVRTVKVQYSKPKKDVDFLQKELDLSSAKAVGEMTFDAILKRHRPK